ncbi:MAG: hypothetical protein GY909_00370 [Oligoflexia bacterium]|nr:hypothetical protein [Oligoflexia bacterium]
MFNKFNQLLVLLTVFLLASCSGGKKSTKAKLTITTGKLASPSLAAYTGGGMLYGRNLTTGDGFAINLIDVAGPLSIQLVNGDWDFYGILWDGVGDGDGEPEFEGDVKCTFSSSLLNGGEVSIALNFNNANCANTVFSQTTNDNAGVNVFSRGLGISSCKDMSGVVGAADLCDQTASNNKDKGFIGSYEVALTVYDTSGLIPDIGGDLISSCFNILSSTDGGTAPNENVIKNFPTGSPGSGIETTIRAYFGQNCNDSQGIQDTVFLDGLFETTAYTKSLEGGTNPTKYLNVFHELTGPEVCLFSYADIYTQFAKGDGSAETPYGICWPEQFDQITSSGLASNYELLQDIDFRGREKLISPNEITCTDLGMVSNMIPVGFNCADYTDNTGVFSGTFNGHGYSLLYPIVHADEADYIGVFKTSSGVISDLEIHKGEFEARSYVGALVGDATAGTIENVVVKDTYIRAEDNALYSYAGGLAGSNSGATIGGAAAVVVVAGTEIEGRGSSIGGIVGDHSGGSIRSAYFDGHINANKDGGGAALFNFGGIAGVAGADIQESFAKGAITAYGIRMGGIAGDVNGGAIIQDTHSHVAIFSHYQESSGTAVDLGGIVGAMTTGTVEDSIFTGTITHNCTNGPLTLCEIGEVGGTFGGTPNTNFSSIDYATTYGGQAATSVLNDTTGAGQIRSATISGFTSTGSWATFVDGYYPRLGWTTFFDFPCQGANDADSVATQVGNGRGTDANPIVICNPGQFTDISTNPSLHYILEDHINLEGVFPGTSANRIASFSGSLNGADRILMGGDVVETTAVANAIFQTLTNTGTISNLNLVGVSTSRTAAGYDPLGLLVATNYGTIEEVQYNGGSVVASLAASGKAGGLVGLNETTGIISDVRGSTFVDSLSTVGGIAAHNKGLIEDSESQMYFSATAAENFYSIGGVVGENEGGTLERVVFGGDINSSPTISGFSNVGGLVGFGNTGSVIEDSYTETHARIDIKNDATNVGGLVGSISGGSTIDRSYNGAEVRYGWCTGGSSTGQEVDENDCVNIQGGVWNLPTTDVNSIGAIAGAVTASTIAADVFYTNPAYTILSVDNITGAVVNGTDCDVTVTANFPVAIGAADGVFIGGHNRYFSNTGGAITAASTPTITIGFDIGGSAIGTDCSDTAASDGYMRDDGRNSALNFTAVKPNTNTFGTQKLDLEMQDPSTFCTDAGFPSGDVYYQCTTGWDIVLDTSDFNGDSTEGDFGDGFERLKDYYFFEMGIDPVREYTTPVWSLEPDEGDYPRHAIH